MTPKQFKDKNTKQRHPMDGLRDMENLSPIDSLINERDELRNALKVAEGALQSMYENGQKQGWNDKYLFSMDRANQALEQIRKVLK